VDETLRHEQVVGIGGEDVGDAVLISIDIYRGLQARQVEVAICLREGSADNHEPNDSAHNGDDKN
jgi:hypothetical protein